MVNADEASAVRLSTGLMLALIVIAWGGNYALVKLALEDISPFTFNVLRFGGAAAVIALLAGVRGRQLLPVRGERAALALVGFCQVTVMLGFTSVGLLWIEASRAVLIAYTMPLWALLLGHLILGERITAARLAGAAIGFAGLGLLFNPLAMDWTREELLLGSAIAVCGSVGWAAGSTLYRTRAWRTPYWAQVFWQAFIGCLPLGLLALLFERGAPIDPTLQLGALVVYNWLIPAALAYWCWAQVLSRMSAATAGQILMLAPVYGVGLAALIFDEPLRPMLLASGLLILAGAWLTLRARAAPAAHKA
jgi:drug/metabolite transporter (DMT)-like permease